MRLSIRGIGLAAVIVFSLIGWSCEKHHVGELPPEKPIDAEHTSAEASPAPTTSPTPAEFFPTSTPR